MLRLVLGFGDLILIYNNIVNVNWLMQEMKIEVPDRLKVVVFLK